MLSSRGIEAELFQGTLRVSTTSANGPASLVVRNMNQLEGILEE
jgi:hypothetical protein